MADDSALAVLLKNSEQRAKESAIKTNALKGTFKDMEAIYRETGVRLAVIRMNLWKNRGSKWSVYVIIDIICQEFCL
jgi:hypothetical protein